MKTKKLKIEGNEKIKVELKFDLDEVHITLLQGGNPTKYKDTLTFQKFANDDSKLEESIIGKTIRRLYGEYVVAKEMEGKLIKLFEDMVYIEIKD